MPITLDYMEALSKEVYFWQRFLYGPFPNNSDIMRSIRTEKMDWIGNDKIQYRTVLSPTSTGGSINSQVYHENGALIKPGNFDVNIYHASYGTVTDGTEVDMLAQLDTERDKVAFEDKHAMDMHMLHTNVASIATCCGIHGQFGVAHQIRSSILAPSVPASFNPQPNVFTPVLGVPFTIKAPINVYQGGFKRGKRFIKTTERRPNGAANVAEMYQCLDNQTGYIVLLPIGTAVSPWQNGEFLEVVDNREVVGMDPNVMKSWSFGAINVTSGAFQGIYDQFTGTGAYTAGENAIVGFPEGLADLFPWYTDPDDMNTRLMLDLPFRDQPNRLLFSAEQAGGWIVQQEDERIMDCIMRGVMMTKSHVPHADVGVWINDITRNKIGYEEGEAVAPLRDNFVAGPLVYQRGMKTMDYQIGNQVVREVMSDMNLPTDVIMVGPKMEIKWSSYDSAAMKIDEYIRETWPSGPPPEAGNMATPKEFTSTLDLTNRLSFSAPVLTDGRMASFQLGNRIRHPKNAMHMSFYEMGAMFTKMPHAYTIIKLREPIVDFTAV